MPTYSDTSTDLIINRLTKTQFDSATGLDPTQEYHVDPEFSGNKLLATDANGDIVESAVAPSGVQTTSNLVTSVSSASTDTQYPSAKLFYDTCGDIETLINAL